MKKCPYCEEEIKENSEKCEYCGEKIESNTGVFQQRSNKIQIFKHCIRYAISLIFVVLGLYIGNNTYGNETYGFILFMAGSVGLYVSTLIKN